MRRLGLRSFHAYSGPTGIGYGPSPSELLDASLPRARAASGKEVKNLFGLADPGDAAIAASSGSQKFCWPLWGGVIMLFFLMLENLLQYTDFPAALRTSINSKGSPVSPFRAQTLVTEDPSAISSAPPQLKTENFSSPAAMFLDTPIICAPSAKVEGKLANVS